MRLDRGIPLLASLLAAAAVATGCESTQEKSARIAASLGPVKEEKGLEITKQSKQVEVLDTTLLGDRNGWAVVVEVRNDSDQTLVDVPIAINVVDAKGKSVFKNNVPGLEPALTSIPMIKPGETLDWVNNQVLPIGKPDSVKVEVGTADPLTSEVPDVEVGEPQLENDKVSGINAAGTAVNKSSEQLERLLIYGVARKGGEIVAAGRAAIERMNPDRNKVYHVYFIGDPSGADLEVRYFPSLPQDGEKKAEGGSSGK